MSKRTKQHDKSATNIPSHLVDDIDEVLIELREFVRASVMSTANSIGNREDAVKEVLRMLQQFANSLNQEVLKAGDRIELQGLAERLLKQSTTQSVDDSLQNVGQLKGKMLLDEHLSQLPFPHYEATPDDSATVVQILEDGTRTVGRFVDRKFVAVDND